MNAQIGNSAGGDLAGRDIYKTIQSARERTPMSQLVELHLAEASTNQALTSWIEKLEHYLSHDTSTDIRGLDEKLTCSGRTDLLEDAIARKEAAYKLIMKNQGSRTAQMILAYLLAEIVVNFEQAVRPLVQNNAPRSEVDKAVLDYVLTPAFKALEANPLMLDKRDIQGFLYFLGGNCHVRWDPC